MKIKHLYTAAAAAACALLAGAGVRPALGGTTVYSFETLYDDTGTISATGTRPDDFQQNGGSTTIAQDTIGATDLAHSMLFAQTVDATFTGAITNLLPAPLYAANAYSISFDLTVPSTGNFNGAFARMGISEFGDYPPAMITGIHVQAPAAAEINISLSPGTHHMTIALIAASNPLTGQPNVSFPSVFGPDPNSQLVAAAFQLFINKSADVPLNVYIDNVAAQNNQTSVWNSDSDGNWSSGSKWIGLPTAVPNAIDALAMFGSISSSGTRTVTVDSPQTVGGIDLNGSGTVVIAGSSALTMDVTSGSGSILTHHGSHIISAPLVLNDNVTMTVEDPVSLLSITGNMTATGKTITTAGKGIVEFKNVRAGGLSVTEGAARIIAGATPNSADSASVVNSLAISSGAILDLTNNSMIIDYTGPVGTRVSDVRNHLSAGRLQSGAATTTTRLGYGDNAVLGKTTFAGQSVDASSVLIKYTYAGDADLDGDADGVDIGTWATNFTGELGGAGSAVWTQGDWDYDGDVDGVDAGLWAQAFTGELGGGGLGSLVINDPTISPGAAAVLRGLGITVVPEPATLGLLGLSGAMALGARAAAHVHGEEVNEPFVHFGIVIESITSFLLIWRSG